MFFVVCYFSDTYYRRLYTKLISIKSNFRERLLLFKLDKNELLTPAKVLNIIKHLCRLYNRNDNLADYGFFHFVNCAYFAKTKHS